ncbi:MAG TPA: hypothetical protein VGR93_00360, partial [Candidatus Acidoferrales bacterium]|nr:hypothetical protein [Candidatus Acidoferrales bacterium]
PTSLQVLSSPVISMTYIQNCGDSSYGIAIAIHYQVLDQNGQTMNASNMEPQEEIVNVVINGQHIKPDPFPNWVDLYPTTYPSSSKYTDSNGQFYDAPFGSCNNSQGFVLTNTQYLSILLNGTRYSVRTNSWEIDSSSSGHGSVTNSTDVTSSR